MHRAVFLQFVHYVEGTKAVKRKREEQVLRTLVSSGASASSSCLRHGQLDLLKDQPVQKTLPSR